MKLIWKTIISIAVIAFIAIIIFLAFKYDPNNTTKTSSATINFIKQDAIAQETFIEYEENDKELEEAIRFIEAVGNIIDEVDSALTSSNYYGDDLDGFISSERSFLRKLDSLNTRLYNLDYPMICASYRNKLCSTFDDICLYEKRLINSLEDLDEFGYNNNLNKLNNSLGNLTDFFNSMLNDLENKYS